MKEQINPSVVQKHFCEVATAMVVDAAGAAVHSQMSRAQDTGYISGTVTDKSGAAVANAEVVITSRGENLTRNTTTNSDGAYVGSALPAGTYDMTVTATGFQKYQAKGVVLPVAQKIARGHRVDGRRGDRRDRRAGRKRRAGGDAIIGHRLDDYRQADRISWN